MSNATEMLSELEGTISSPAASALRTYVLRGDRARALQIFQDERFSLEQAEELYSYCKKLWSGADVDLVEIPLERAAQTFAALSAAAGPDCLNPPRYIIRDGLRLFESGAYLENGKWHVFLSGEGFVSLSRIRQLWHIQSRG